MDDLQILLPEVNTNGSLPSMQLPEIGDYNFWDLYTNRILSIDGEITDWDYHIVKDIISINMKDKEVCVEERKPIIMLVNSNGGLLDITNSILDIMEISTTPIWTVNMGQALSGGCLIFLAGEKRFTTNKSYCMTHSGSGGTSGTYEQTVEQQKVYNEQIKNMGAYIMERTGIDEKTWKKYKNKDWYLNADQQIEYGFATEKLQSLDQIWRG